MFNITITQTCVLDVKCVTPLSEVFIASGPTSLFPQQREFPSERMIRKMQKRVFGIPIPPPPCLLMAEFSISRPVNKAESKGKERSTSSKWKRRCWSSSWREPSFFSKRANWRRRGRGWRNWQRSQTQQKVPTSKTLLKSWPKKILQRKRCQEGT